MSEKRLQRTRKGQGPLGPDETTLKTRINRKDPAIDRLADAASLGRPQGFLEYQRYLARFDMVSPESRTNLNFMTLSKTLRAVTHVDLGRMKADILFSRSTAFLVFDALPDFGKLKALVPSVDFTDRATLAVCGRERICILQVNSTELATLLTLSVLSSPRPVDEGGKAVPKEAMPIGEMTIRQAMEMRARMGNWKVEYSTPGFDFEAFRKKIEICKDFHGRNGSIVYVVALSDGPVYSINYHTPWKKGAGRQDEHLRAVPTVCWLNDGGKLYMVKEETFV